MVGTQVSPKTTAAGVAVGQPAPTANNRRRASRGDCVEPKALLKLTFLYGVVGCGGRIVAKRVVIEEVLQRVDAETRHTAIEPATR